MLLEFDRKDRAHAVVPKYRAGKLVVDNEAELTLPLHAFAHLIAKESLTTRGVDQNVNRWAVGAIVRRMTPAELNEFNRLVSIHETDRRNGNWP